MKSNIFLSLAPFLFLPFLLNAQSQIGSDIDGDVVNGYSSTGLSISSDGNIVAIGTPYNDLSSNGAVRTFENQSGTWTQVGGDIVGLGGKFGTRVSLSSNGGIIAISAPGDNGDGTEANIAIGAVRVYEKQSGVWEQIGNTIYGEKAYSQSGTSISLSSIGNILAIGTEDDNSNGSSSGHVRVYQNIADVWTQIGSDIDGDAEDDYFGESISLSSNGNFLAIGAPGITGTPNSIGYVRIFQNLVNVWTKIGGDIIGEAVEDFSGSSISLSSDGTIVAVGAYGNNGNGTDSGHVRVYQNQAGTWTQIGQDIDGEAAIDGSGFGTSLSADGSIVAIGAAGNDGNGNNSGHARIYQNQAGIWTKIGTDLNGEAINDNFGNSISLSSNGSVVAIGSANNGSFRGHVRVYDLSGILSTNDFILSQFNMYPNPTKNEFTIQLKDGLQLEKVNIYNNLGQFISTSKDNIVKTSELSAGVYFVEIVTNKGKDSKKIVIK